MKGNHHGFVFRTDGPYGDASPVLSGPVADVLNRIWADGGFWQILLARLYAVNNDASIEGDQPFRRREQWIDIDLFDPGLFNHKPAEAHHKLVEIGQGHRPSPAYAFERSEDASLLHHSPRKRGVEGRQRQRAVLVNFH